MTPNVEKLVTISTGHLTKESGTNMEDWCTYVNKYGGGVLTLA